MADPTAALANVYAAQQQRSAAAAAAQATIEAAQIAAQANVQSTQIGAAASTYQTQLGVRAQQENLAAQIQAERWLAMIQAQTADMSLRNQLQMARENLTAQIYQTREQIASAERMLGGNINAENARFAAEHGLGVEQFNLQKAMFEAEQFANPADWIKQASYLRNAPAPQGGPLQTGRVDVPFNPAAYQPGQAGAGPTFQGQPSGGFSELFGNNLAGMFAPAGNFTYGNLPTVGGYEAPGASGGAPQVSPLGMHGPWSPVNNAATQGSFRGGDDGLRVRGYAVEGEVGGGCPPGYARGPNGCERETFNPDALLDPSQVEFRTGPRPRVGLAELGFGPFAGAAAEGGRNPMPTNDIFGTGLPECPYPQRYDSATGSCIAGAANGRTIGGYDDGGPVGLDSSGLDAFQEAEKLRREAERQRQAAIATQTPAPGQTQPLPPDSLVTPAPPPGSQPAGEGAVSVGGQLFRLQGGLWKPDQSQIDAPKVSAPGRGDPSVGSAQPPNAAMTLAAGGNPAGMLNPQATSFGGFAPDQFGLQVPLPTEGASRLLSPHGTESPEDVAAFEAWQASLGNYQGQLAQARGGQVPSPGGLSEGAIPPLQPQEGPLPVLKTPEQSSQLASQFAQQALASAQTAFAPAGQIGAGGGQPRQMVSTQPMPGMSASPTAFTPGGYSAFQEMVKDQARRRIRGGDDGLTAKPGLYNPVSSPQMPMAAPAQMPQPKDPSLAPPQPQPQPPAMGNYPPQPPRVPGKASYLPPWMEQFMGQMPWGRVPGMDDGTGMMGQGETVVLGERGPEVVHLPPGSRIVPIGGPDGGGRPMFNVQPANGPAQHLLGGGGMMPMRFMGMDDGTFSLGAGDQTAAQTGGSTGTPYADQLATLQPAPVAPAAPAPAQTIINLPSYMYPNQQAPTAAPAPAAQQITGYGPDGKPIYGTGGQQANPQAVGPAGWNGYGYTPEQLAQQPWLQAASSGARLPAWQAYGGPLSLSGMPGGSDVFGPNFPSVPAPHQFSPQNWATMLPQEREMLLATWRALGIGNEDAMALMQRPLPQLTNPRPTAWRV